jgi:WD40 repeat protein
VTPPTARLARLAAPVLLLAALAGCTRSRAPRTATPPPVLTQSPTPSSTPAATATTVPPAPAITADNAKDLAPAASVRIAGFSRSAWSADGSEFLVVTQDGLVEIDAATGQAGAPIDVSSAGRLLGIGPDGHTVALATDTGVRLWDLATGRDIGMLYDGTSASTTIDQAVFTGDGKTVALVHVDQIGVTLWDVATARQTGALSGFQTAAPVYSVRLNGDGTEAACVARATVQFADVQTNTLGARLSFEQFVANAQFLPNGDFLTVVPGGGANGGVAMTVTTWDPASGKQRSSFAIPTSTADVAISPDGTLAAAATATAVTVWDVATGEQVANLPTAGIPARLESFSPTGITLASMLDDGTLQFLRVRPATGRNST